eukprot:1611480-Pyramimonas_sp.AAC.1
MGRGIQLALHTASVKVSNAPAVNEKLPLCFNEPRARESEQRFCLTSFDMNEQRIPGEDVLEN